jgi:hypothetical protein
MVRRSGCRLGLGGPQQNDANGNGRSSAHSAIACWFTVTNLPLNSARAAFWSSTVRDEPVIALALGVRAG